MNRNAWRSAVLVAAALAATAGPARAQSGADAALRDRVAQLIERLESPKAEARNAAEEALVKLGPKALSLVPEPAKGAEKDLAERLERIRAKLREAQDEQSTDASRVTIQQQGLRLSEALRILQTQTGNLITDLREQMGADATNPALDLDIVDKPFFEALDLVCKQAGLTPSFATGDGSIGLIPGGEGLPVMIPAPKPMIQYTGPFRAELKLLAASQNFQGGARTANAQFEVAWEPRLRPMILALKANEATIVDNDGEAVAPAVTDESSSVVLRPENPSAEINFNLEAPRREAQSLKTLKIKADVTIPAGLRTFRFPNLAEKGVKQSQGDITITLDDCDVEDYVWKVDVTLKYAGGGEAFESYQQGLFNNRLWLQRADGSRFEQNGGFNQTGAGEGTLGFQYLFVDAPGKPADYQFVYETPSQVVKIPLEVEFTDVPLP